MPKAIRRLALSVIKTELREGKYAWPGGYPKYFLCADGEALSYEAACENFKQIAHAHCYPDYRNERWTLVAYDVNWEDPDLHCSHTGERIESAYGSDQ
jgi:hypothetical protein